MRLVPVLLGLSIATAAHAVEPNVTPAGGHPVHSMRGEAFADGPRQIANLMDGVGNVNFPITTSLPIIQQYFNQGVAQLHGFAYFEAERTFRQIALFQPNKVMAYWGMAMANVNNPKRAAAMIKIAVEKRDKASPREQKWIDAYAAYFSENKADEKKRRETLVKALETMVLEFPNDVEAKAFLVFQIWDNSQHGVPITSRVAVDSLIREVLAVEPMHPGMHHYRIHLWNTGEGDKYALESAASCGQAAPGIAHMWHMSGHTFSKLKRYADAAWQQEAASRVDNAYLAKMRLMPEQIHNYAHNSDWLVKNLVYTGRVHEALDLAKNLIELPRLGPNKNKAYDMGRDRLLETLLRFELWDEIAALAQGEYLKPEGGQEAAILAAVGSAQFRRGQKTEGEKTIVRLEEVLKRKRQERVAAADAAEAKALEEKKKPDEVAKAMADALKLAAGGIKSVEAAIAEVQVYGALANGDQEKAKTELAKATNIQSERRARIQLELGNKEEAEKLARDAAKSYEAETPALASLAQILWKLDKKKDALETFEKLRTISGQIDLDIPLYAALAPLATEAEAAADWRTPLTVPADAGVRPDLAALGPFRWQPTPAPAWSLPDFNERTVSLADYRGRAVLVVFYLGSGCPHCIEQLNVFSPVTKQFADAGISIIAVSTDTVPGLADSFAKAKESGGFQFPIVSDQSLTTFRAYGAYDDFGHQALHGTYLIDAAGLVRWQNISSEPFNDEKWLLNECQRLLKLPAPNASALTTR